MPHRWRGWSGRATAPLVWFQVARRGCGIPFVTCLKAPAGWVRRPACREGVVAFLIRRRPLGLPHGPEELGHAKIDVVPVRVLALDLLHQLQGFGKVTLLFVD